MNKAERAALLILDEALKHGVKAKAAILAKLARRYDVILAEAVWSALERLAGFDPFIGGPI